MGLRFVSWHHSSPGLSLVLYFWFVGVGQGRVECWYYVKQISHLFTVQLSKVFLRDLHGKVEKAIKDHSYLVVLSSSCIFLCRILWIWSNMFRRKCLLRENSFTLVFKIQNFCFFNFPCCTYCIFIFLFSYKSAKIFLTISKKL